MKKILLSIIMSISLFSFSANVSEVSLTDYNTKKMVKINKGKKTYVKLWASWCPTCLYSLPHTLKLTKEKNLDFDVVTVVSPNNKGELSEKDFREWWSSLSEFKDVKVLFDEKGKLIEIAKVRAYPTNLFINSKGEIKKILFGALPNEFIKNTMKNID